MRCLQCGELPHACRFDATCELSPVEGYRSPCVLKPVADARPDTGKKKHKEKKRAIPQDA